MRTVGAVGRLTVSVVVVALGMGANVRGQARTQDEVFKKLLAEKSGPLVTVKFLLKVQMPGMLGGGGDQESESEAGGVMIDPKGIVLCSNTQLGGFASMMRRMMGRMGEGITATPSEIKVLIGDESEGKDAEIVARDTELDLAWVKIKEPGDKPFEAIDFSKNVKPHVGQPVYSARRMGKYFGRVPVIGEGSVGGTTVKPRELYVPSGMVTAGMGVPVFTATGEAVGFVIMQTPEAEDGGDNPMAMLSRMSNMGEMFGGFILPASEVVKATARALATTEKKAGE